jgi:hypothetical protein
MHLSIYCRLFLASAKRLYIVQNPASRDKGNYKMDMYATCFAICVPKLSTIHV